jgi:ribosomal protein L29
MTRSQISTNKDVSINGRPVIVNWKKVRLLSPENLQDRIHVNEKALEEIKKQKTTEQVSTNTANL